MCVPLWKRTAEWEQLRQFHIDIERIKPSFYRDSGGWVTIGIGYLVDVPGGSLTARQAEAGRFINANHSHFRTATGDLVTQRQVWDDWELVRSGTINSGALRLLPPWIERLYHARTRGFLNTMYNGRSFSRCLPSGIQMALVDARYNPSGVPVFAREDGADGRAEGEGEEQQEEGAVRDQVRRMWRALNRDSPTAAQDYDPSLALQLFEQIWEGRGGRNHERYQRRHQWRVARFREGVEEMLAEDEQRAREDREFDQLIDDLANGR
ncbi:hypothetical protein [Sorangium sp. So ce131]|uniref:hypothetical protein n=1 Tax=Sorangium sp. So ce131 TaxID=3133282 RepID=UPI003F62C165